MQHLFDSSRLPSTGRLLAFDHGTKTIGVALCDVSQQFVEPLETLIRKSAAHDRMCLTQLVEKQHPVGLVVGYPLNMDGTAGARCQSVRAFAKQLEDAFALPLILWDERQSSEAAQAMLEEAATSSKRGLDALAAAVILQSLLDSRRANR